MATPSSLISQFIQSPKNLTEYGQLGDYVGGVWGTVIAAITFFLVLATFWASRRHDYRARVFEIFSEMMRTHEEIVSGMNYEGLTGRQIFQSSLSEFYKIYELIQNVPGQEWSIQQRIEIAYNFMFFGPYFENDRHLSEIYGEVPIRKLSGEVHRERQLKPNSKRHYKGHQLYLGHYFRNLFNAYSFIDSAKLSKKEKMQIAKILRSKLSNHEQALLALNTMTSLGADWENSGYIACYKPFKNVPQYFLSFDRDFSLKSRFPYVNFEWEKRGSKRTIIRSLVLTDRTTVYLVQRNKISDKKIVHAEIQ